MMRSLWLKLLPLTSLSTVLPAPAASQVVPGSPLAFVQAMLARHRIVFLGDIHPLADPKRLVAELVELQAPDAAIDILALEVSSDQQEAIDLYLRSEPEDTTILLGHPRTLRVHWGASREYLDIYRAVYRWNRAHPDHPTQVVAADIRGWPVAPLSAGMAVGAFVNRDEWMAAAMKKWLGTRPDSRVLVFMGGYHGLRTGGGSVRVGQSHDRFDHWLAGYLSDAGFPMYVILADARQDSGHGATRVFDVLAAVQGPSAPNYVVQLGAETDAVREPLYDVEQEGYALEFWPSRFALRAAVDAILVLREPTPITLLPAMP